MALVISHLLLPAMRNSAIGEEVMEGEIEGGDDSDGSRLRSECRAAQQMRGKRQAQLQQRSQQVGQVKASPARKPGAAVPR